jgi:4-carboxymuconolactone decarboxylase
MGIEPYATPEDCLRALAAGQASVLETLARMEVGALARSGLDEETYLLIRLAALVATDAALLARGAAPVSYQWSVEAALDADATTEEILGTMIAVAPISGIARVVQATPDVALQLGYDLDTAFEELD